jgi:hypothetical protein
VLLGRWKGRSQWLRFFGKYRAGKARGAAQTLLAALAGSEAHHREPAPLRRPANSIAELSLFNDFRRHFHRTR